MNNKISNISKSFFIIKINLVILFILFIISSEIKYYHRYKRIIIKNIKEKENYTNKIEALKNGRKFLNTLLKDNYINKKFKIFKHPKISIIIPLYNSEKFIKLVIKSIQNQNFRDLEILLINDFSSDNTLKIIEKIKEEDLRIIIIKNKKNMGILYSRSIGVLQSKGEYIINLDHDDLFFDEDVLDTSYKIAKKDNFDIISFMFIEGKSYYSPINKMKDNYCTNHFHNLTIFQPELSYYPLFKNEQFLYHDYVIWGKLFKNNIYIKAINLLGKERYSSYNIYNEDLIGIFVVFKIARSFKYIRKYGIFHLIHKTSASNTADLEHRIYNDIFFTEIIYDLSKKENKKYAALFAKDRFKNIRIFSQKNFIFLRKILNQILYSQYIEEKYKQPIKKNYHELLYFNNYKINN